MSLRLSRARSVRVLEMQRQSVPIASSRKDAALVGSDEVAGKAAATCEGFLAGGGRGALEVGTSGTSEARVLAQGPAAGSARDAGEVGIPPPLHANSVCLHAACSSMPYCFVSELKRVRESYLEGRLDQFKKKAIDKAIT